LWGSFLENFWYLIVFGYGAIVGSFLNVLIYRMPLGMSISHPKSHCPNCNQILGPWENVPLFGFLALGGRCRNPDCRIPISWRYFCVELLTACLWTALFHQIAGRTMVSWADFIAQALFASLLVAAIFIDLDHFLIPDELNWTGIALALVRDVACIGLAWVAGTYYLRDALDRFTYFGWLPTAIPGALAYGGVLVLVSFAGFVVYARVPRESVFSVARRFFTLEDPPEDGLQNHVLGGAPIDEPLANAPDPAGLGTIAPTPFPADGDEDDDASPVRLRFSPAFITLVSAMLLWGPIGPLAILVFFLPLAAFVWITRGQGEALGAAVARFFRSNDLDMADGAADLASIVDEPEPEEMPLLPGDERLLLQRAAHVPSPDPASVAVATPARTMAEESDQFAKEAETGKHGGMGLGDVKLALAIGAMLGPGQAIVSLFIATAFGAVTGVTLARIHNKSLRQPLPFGPFMALGAIIMMIYGRPLLEWYFVIAMPHSTP
jgi:prepilin signal peptidase PulO-like enzyme (type II secretory pathway)